MDPLASRFSLVESVSGAQGDDVIAIPGTRRKDRFNENAGAMAVSLTPDEVARISAAVRKGSASGTRYPAGGMKGVYI